MKKALLSLALALTLALGLGTPAPAAEALPTVPAGYSIIRVEKNIDYYNGHHLFHDGLMPISEVTGVDEYGYQEGRSGYLNTKGEVLFNFPGACEYAFSEGLAPFWDQDAEALGYMDTTGKAVIPATFEMYMGMGQTLVGRFVGGNALVYHRNADNVGVGTWTQIDRTGQTVPTTLDVQGDDTFCHEGGDSFGVSYEIVEINGAPTVLQFSEGYALVNRGMTETDYSHYYIISNAGVTPPAPVTAASAASTMLVDGKSVSFDAYVIAQSNYIKLRDFAQAVNGTGKQFEVEWDNYTASIDLSAGKAYTPVGGELAHGDGTAKTATVNTAPIYLDDRLAPLRAYTIGGNNYFKLRDLCAALDIFVDWDAKTGTVSIDTTKGYVAE